MSTRNVRDMTTRRPRENQNLISKPRHGILQLTVDFVDQTTTERDEDKRTGINKCNLCKVESDKRYAPNFLARIPSLNKVVYDLKTFSMVGLKPQQ